MIWTACRCAALSLSLTVVSCGARAPLNVATDAAAEGAEVASRVPSAVDAAVESLPDAGPAVDAAVESLPDGSLADASGSDGATTCQPAGGGMFGLRLLGIQPTQVTTHTSVTFTVTYEGELPDPLTLWARMGSVLYHLNPETVHTDTSSFKISFPIETPAGPRRFSLLQGTNPSSLLEIGWLDCAVRVATRPASPVLVPPPDSNTLGIPLHPELNRLCARSGSFGLSNRGDDPVAVRQVTLAGSAAFTIQDDNCTNQSLGYDADLEAPCTVNVCFWDSTPGTDAATLTFHTSAGDLGVDVSNEVLPETVGLDRSFAGTGARLLPSWGFYQNAHVIRGATLLNNGASLAIWDPTYALLFVSADGAPWLPPVGEVPSADGFVLDSFSAVRAGGPGQGIYATVSPLNQGNAGSVVRFFDDGTRDMGFAGTGILLLDDFLFAAYGGIEVQPSGRVLVIGGLGSSPGVRAFRSTGEEDVAYRTAVSAVLTDSVRGAVRAIDAGGRLYVATTSGVIRLHADGGIDGGFSFTGPVEALAVDRDQRLLVAGMGTVSRLEESGAATRIPLAEQPELATPLVGMAEDARRRILLLSNTGVVLRHLSDGTFDDRVGFAEGGARAVVCPPQAGCLIAGTLYEGYAGVDRPTGTTLDEFYVLRLAP